MRLLPGNRKNLIERIPGGYLFLGICLFCVALISLTYADLGVTAPINRVFSFLVVPFERGLSSVADGLVERHLNRVSMEELQEENRRLREENAALIVANTELSQERYELEELRDLFRLDGRYDSYEKTGARIIAKDTGNFYHSFVIDKGWKDGLAVDMNVLADGGLVGRITQVGGSWSRVDAIIDDSANVTGTVLSTGDNLIVTGSLALYSEKKLSFSRLFDQDEAATVGDAIVTSNVSDKYLPGILIGYISRVEKDPNNLTRRGEIVPAVDFSRLDTVLVILKTKEELTEEGAGETP